MHLNFNLLGNKVPTKVLYVLLTLDIFLLLAYILILLVDVNPLLSWQFDLDKERTISSVYSALKLFCIGFIFLLSDYWVNRHRTVSARFLTLVGIGFLFLSLDEALAIHERISRFFKPIAWYPMFQGRHGAWIPLYLMASAALLVTFRRTLVAMFRVYRLQMLIMATGVATVLIGAVGLEIISYQYLRGPDYSSLYTVQVAVEEFLEMVGTSLFLYGTLLCAVSRKVVERSCEVSRH